MSQPGSGLFASVLPWLLVLLGVVIVGGCVIFALRRWIRGEDPPSEGFTLHDLRRLHAEGGLSDDEYESARRAIIERVRPVRSDNDPGAGGASE